MFFQGDISSRGMEAEGIARGLLFNLRMQTSCVHHSFEQKENANDVW